MNRLDSNTDATGNDTMNVDEEKGHEEATTKPLLQEGWASSHSCYTEYSGAQMAHGPSLLNASEDAGGGGDDDDDGSEHRGLH